MNYILPEKAYLFCKWFCLIALPAVGLLYVTLAPIWGWPMADGIQKTCDAIGLFLGTLIGISQVTATEAPDA